MEPSGNELPSAVLIVGCGDVGQRVAQRLQSSRRELRAIVRSQPSADALRALGIDAQALDLDHVAPASVPAAPLVVYLAPPPASGDRDPRLRAFLAALQAPPRRIVYVSTSGVYGDCEGRWVDEDAPLRPASERARRRVDAEQALADYARIHGSEVVVLRVPGIYGPGRLPQARLAQGLPVIRDAEAPWSNRIHAEDLADALLLAARHGRPGRAYNVADGTPTSMSDYFRRCAALLNLPPPREVSLDEARRSFTPAMWSFVEESRRLDTRRARTELHFVPRYPDFAAGLPSCLAAPHPSPATGVPR